jgi:hypothetical protein
VPALQTQSPKFNCQFHPGKKKKLTHTLTEVVEHLPWNLRPQIQTPVLPKINKTTKKKYFTPTSHRANLERVKG